MRFLSLHTLTTLTLAPVLAAQAVYVTRPDLNPVTFNVSYSTPGSQLDDGYVFLSPRASAKQQAALQILEPSGELIWMEPAYGGAFDFRPQVYENTSYLAFFYGYVSTAGYGQGSDLLLHSNYSIFKNLTATNSSDIHEFLINGDQSATATVYNAIGPLDLSAYNASGTGYILDGCFQDLDVGSGAPMFTFCSWEAGIGLDEAYNSPGGTGDSAENAWDYIHVNAVEKDAAGNYLLSARHTHAAYYIDGRTGTILWRLGGKNSSFTGNGTEFSWQHDIRWRDNLTASDIANNVTRYLSIYDNASSGFANSSDQSRGMYVELDMVARTATLLTIYTVPNELLLSASQGNLQFLSNGNVLMGYGSLPVFAEYDKNGTALQVTHFGAADTQSYRAFKMPWVGAPTTSPNVTVANGTLYVSWNGATEVDRWSLMQGESQGAWNNITNTTRIGFETAIPLGGNYSALQVAALDSLGNSLAMSEVLAADGTGMGGAVAGTGNVASTSSRSGGGAGGNADAATQLAPLLAVQILGAVAVLAVLAL